MSRKIALPELERIAENWFQRAHKLREIWQDEQTPQIKKEKAFRLWVTMTTRVLRAGHALSEYRIKKNAIIKFPAGGLLAKKDEP